eukprot:1764724-Rhodomonas_salina.1
MLNGAGLRLLLAHSGRSGSSTPNVSYKHRTECCHLHFQRNMVRRSQPIVTHTLSTQPTRSQPLCRAQHWSNAHALRHSTAECAVSVLSKRRGDHTSAPAMPSHPSSSLLPSCDVIRLAPAMPGSPSPL